MPGVVSNEACGVYVASDTLQPVIEEYNSGIGLDRLCRCIQLKLSTNCYSLTPCASAARNTMFLILSEAAFSYPVKINTHHP